MSSRVGIKLKHLNKQQIVDIYFFNKEGRSQEDIAKILNIPRTTVKSCMEIIYKRWNPHKKAYKSQKTYDKAISIIKGKIVQDGFNKYNNVKKEVNNVIATVEQNKPDLSVLPLNKEETIFAKLEKTYKDYQDAISEYIDFEVSIRVGSIKKENEDLKLKLKEQEELIVKTQSIVDNLKHSNLIDSLRERFSQLAK